MKVREILKQKGDRVVTVKPDETVDTLTHRLRMDLVGALIVSEDGGALHGIVSERDVVHCLAQHGASGLEKRVADIMATQVLTCAPDDNISAVARTMTIHRVRHVPVLDGKVLAGIVSIGDVVKSRLEEMELESSVLRDLAVAGH